MTPGEALDGAAVAIMGCRPVIPNAVEREAEQAIGKSIANPYDDSIKMLCEGGCLREVWVGPRQQAMLTEHGKERFLIACLPCAVAQANKMNEEQGPITIGTYNLGNTHPDD